MRILGIATTVVVGVGLAAVAVIVLDSLPDIKRYLRIREM
jgi:hypothetical protein